MGLRKGKELFSLLPLPRHLARLSSTSLAKISFSPQTPRAPKIEDGGKMFCGEIPSFR